MDKRNDGNLHIFIYILIISKCILLYLDASGSELMTYQPYNNVDISDFLNSSNSADKNGIFGWIIFF